MHGVGQSVAEHARGWLAHVHRRLRRPEDRRRLADLVVLAVMAELTVGAIVAGSLSEASVRLEGEPPVAVQATASDAPATDEPGGPGGPDDGSTTPDGSPSVEQTADEQTAEEPPAGPAKPTKPTKQAKPAPKPTAYERYARDAHEIIARIPTLEVKRQQFPASPMTRNIGAQKERIAQLDERAEVSVEGFADFTIDMSRRRAFVDLEWYHERIRPRMFIVHWTGMGYRDVDHFVSSLKPYRVQFFIDRDADVYQLFETDRQMPAHARGANEFAQGVEIETGRYDGTTSPLFRYTPAQIEQTVYLAVEFLRRNDLPVDETTLLGHYAADLIFSNPHYRPRDARFSEKTIRKFDPPQELMEVIVRKAKVLDAALDAAEPRWALGTLAPP